MAMSWPGHAATPRPGPAFEAVILDTVTTGIEANDEIDAGRTRLDSPHRAPQAVAGGIRPSRGKSGQESAYEPS